MTQRLNLRFMLFCMMLMATQLLSAQSFKINADGYYNASGIDVMVFNDLSSGLPGGQGVLAFGGERAECSEPCINDDDFALSASRACADEMAAVGRP